MEQFVAGQQNAKPVVSIACGQQAAVGFVKTAVERFLKEHPESRVRLPTPRGKARIEGVAGDQFDMAIVTDSPTTIHRIAGMELYIETLFQDRFALVANPLAKAPWTKQFNTLHTDHLITARELLGLPFILPEPDTSRRQQLDDWMHKATCLLQEVVLETGCWQAILEFSLKCLGVGIVAKSTENSLDRTQKNKLTSRMLDGREFSFESVKIITRKVHGAEESVSTPKSLRLIDFLRINASSL